MTQVPPPPPSPQAAPPPTVPVCYRHPKRETYVRCVRCDRPICPECMNEASVGFQCPECVTEGRRTQRSARTVFGGTLAGASGRVTAVLIAINVIVAVISVASAAGAGDLITVLSGRHGTPLTEWGAVIGQARYVDGSGNQFIGPYGIADGEYYRFVTNMFLHYGVFHLLMNMWALWVLGRSLEAALGPLRFGALYLVSGLGGGVFAYLFSPLGATAGASGAIFGLFAALFIVFKRLRRNTSAFIPIIVLNVLISLLPGISFFGHLGGAITGAIMAFVLAYAPQKMRNAAFVGVVAGLLLVFAVAVLVKTPTLQEFIPV